MWCTWCCFPIQTCLFSSQIVCSVLTNCIVLTNCLYCSDNLPQWHTKPNIFRSPRDALIKMCGVLDAVFQSRPAYLVHKLFVVCWQIVCLVLTNCKVFVLFWQIILYCSNNLTPGSKSGKWMGGGGEKFWNILSPFMPFPGPLTPVAAVTADLWCNCSFLLVLSLTFWKKKSSPRTPEKDTTAYLSTHTVYWYKIHLFFIILGGYGHIGKRIQQNIIFMRFCCLNWAKRLKNCRMSSWHMPLPNAHWLP